VGWLPAEHLVGQVVHDETVAAGERGDEAGIVVAIVHGQGGQLQAGDPTFGARLQRRHVGGG
jgi:hypothetical protein